MQDNIDQLNAELQQAARGSRTARRLERQLAAEEATLLARADALVQLTGAVQRGEAKLEDLQKMLDELGPAPEGAVAQDLAPVAAETPPVVEPVAEPAAAPEQMISTYTEVPGTPEEIRANLVRFQDQYNQMKGFDKGAAVTAHTNELQGLYRDAEAMIPDYMGSPEDTKVFLDSLIQEGYLSKMPKVKTADGIAAELDRNLAAELKTAKDDAIAPIEMRMQELQQQIAEHQDALAKMGEPGINPVEAAPMAPAEVVPEVAPQVPEAPQVTPVMDPQRYQQLKDDVESAQRGLADAKAVGSKADVAAESQALAKAQEELAAFEATTTPASIEATAIPQDVVAGAPVAPAAVTGSTEAHTALADAANAAQQRIAELEAQTAGASSAATDAAASKAMARRSEKAWRAVAEDEGLALTADGRPDFSKMGRSGDFETEAEVREAFPEYDAFVQSKEQADALSQSSNVKSAQDVTREVYAQKEIVRANDYVNSAGIQDPLDVQRLHDAAMNGKLDNVIKNVEAEAKIAAKEQKELAQSVASVTDRDPMAASAVRHNIEEPKVVEKVVQDTVQKEKHAEVLGPAVPDALPAPEETQQVLIQHHDEFAAERADLERRMENQRRSNKGVSTKLQNRANELDELMGHLSDGMERIDQLDTKYQEMRQPFIDDARHQFDANTQAALQENRNLRQALAVSLDADAKAAKQFGKAVTNAEWKTFLHSPQAEWAWSTAVNQGFTKISRTAQAPGHVDEAIQMLTRVSTRGELPKFMKYFDQLTQLFKTWAVTSPSFAIRNTLSHSFMNYFFGVDPGMYRNYFKASFAFNDAIKAGKTIDEAFLAVPKELQEAYKMVHYSGVINHGGQVSAELSTFRDMLGSKQPQNLIQRLSDLKVNQLSYAANAKGIEALRGAAAMHAAMNGRGLEGIYDLVFKAHFDYGDLNNFEKQVMKRVSPFYTWFRKALPTMMEGVIRNPKAFARYGEFKNAIESVSAPEDLMPGWMSEGLSIRLPFGLPGGQTYLMPDMPFRTLETLSDPVKSLSGQLNPLIKTPIEMQMDNKLFFGKSAPFQGLVQMPGYLQPLAPLMSAIGMAEFDANGQPMMQDKSLYAMEQFFPLLGRARRMLPNEPKYQDRLPVTWANFLFGASMRVNTKVDKTGEVYARQKVVDNIASQLNDLGYGGYEYWKKQLATSSKPTSTDRRPYLTLIQPKGGLPSDSPYTSLPTRQSAADVLSKALASSQLQSVVAASAAARSLSSR
jgi:hypothetical protein